MFYSLMSGLYTYFFPEALSPKKEPQQTKESAEYELLMDRTAIVLKTFDDEKEAAKLAKKKHMELSSFQDSFMYQCYACYKHRFPENISFLYKDLKTKEQNDPNNMLITCCKDDEACIIEAREIRKIL